MPLRDGPLTLAPRATFRIVGIELGLDDGPVSAAHALPRVASALLAGRRLSRLAVPAGLAARLWRTAVLPQALYGCELRTIPRRALQGLAAQGRSLVPAKAPEVVCGLPLDPSLDMSLRCLRWLWTLGNQTSLASTVHRFLATLQHSS